MEVPGDTEAAQQTLNGHDLEDTCSPWQKGFVTLQGHLRPVVDKRAERDFSSHTRLATGEWNRSRRSPSELPKGPCAQWIMRRYGLEGR